MGETPTGHPTFYGDMMPTKCSPGIWNKFTHPEQILWQKLFDVFVVDAHYPPLFAGKTTQAEREITAHNMACRAIWVLQKLKYSHRSK